MARTPRMDDHLETLGPAPIKVVSSASFLLESPNADAALLHHLAPPLLCFRAAPQPPSRTRDPDVELVPHRPRAPVTIEPTMESHRPCRAPSPTSPRDQHLNVPCSKPPTPRANPPCTASSSSTTPCCPRRHPRAAAGRPRVLDLAVAASRPAERVLRRAATLRPHRVLLRALHHNIVVCNAGRGDRDPGPVCHDVAHGPYRGRAEPRH
ncbi:uncharacterized protein LOC110436084 [Sorghum bicolor]|uniref:uncharacterized protein LOC110436084 n=1 Tax=Sorghum bicolor TaxID=4558 RepID=UPI000B425DAC|nr:uncharacterized protein LOC110436084 [Sorghum bicolor]XP_021317906.1 uncharacterized protein LOC110436084 [Sorghum bicolor]|eukprot:XP_021317905.1 uncharacterized protein LOC110436084 [Sorghum bicolor]